MRSIGLKIRSRAQRHQIVTHCDCWCRLWPHLEILPH